MATDDTPDKLNVMLMGHSFVRRLRNWAFDHQKLNLNLDRNRVSVFWHGVGGGFVVRPSNVRHYFWVMFRPTLCLGTITIMF